MLQLKGSPFNYLVIGVHTVEEHLVPLILGLTLLIRVIQLEFEPSDPLDGLPNETWSTLDVIEILVRNVENSCQLMTR